MPGNETPLTTTKIILLNASITMTNSEKDKRSPCHKPLELLKNMCRSPKPRNTSRKYMSYPRAPLPKTKPPQHVPKKNPINMIISFFLVGFADATRFTRS
jgi:hypothetical protein